MMNSKLPSPKELNKALIAALALMFGGGGLWLISPRTHAQEPNRQLVQAD